jgi:aminoglycoside 6-adenylyltransferase
MHAKYSETVEQIRLWAQRTKDVHCVHILGSQVRRDSGGDEWSDLDLLLLVDNPDAFRQTNSWLAFLGEILCEIAEEAYLDWIQLTWYTKRVLLADNRAIDFSIMPYERIEDVLSLNAEIHANGYQVIYDAGPDWVAPKIEATLATLQEEPPRVPTEDELWRTIQILLFQLVFAGKKLKRKELWVAVSCINQQVSHQLLALIEFHTALVVGTPQRIRYEGRFLEQRMAPPLAEKLARCFAKYDTQDAIRTTHHLIDFSYCLAQEICEKSGYPFKPYLFDRIQALYNDMFSGGA